MACPPNPLKKQAEYRPGPRTALPEPRAGAAPAGSAGGSPRHSVFPARLNACRAHAGHAGNADAPPHAPLRGQAGSFQAAAGPRSPGHRIIMTSFPQVAQERVEPARAEPWRLRGEGNPARDHYFLLKRHKIEFWGIFSYQSVVFSKIQAGDIPARGFTTGYPARQRRFFTRVPRSPHGELTKIVRYVTVHHSLFVTVETGRCAPPRRVRAERGRVRAGRCPGTRRAGNAGTRLPRYL